jgi:hypothetical protein
MAICLEGADTDLDDMPDVYETVQGFNPEDGTDGDDDADEDGYRNRDEWGAGTDPHNADSLLRISRVEPIPSSGWRIFWPSVSGKMYSLWRGTNAMTSFDLVIDEVGATPGTNDYLDTTAPIHARELYYLIEVEDAE